MFSQFKTISEKLGAAAYNSFFNARVERGEAGWEEKESLWFARKSIGVLSARQAKTTASSNKPDWRFFSDNNKNIGDVRPLKIIGWMR